MTVVPLESLPLGFRFRPTDEELVNHYLKRKITGEIQSEREVIPEIDVCKCEPWDLPDKALIRSDDPEWFFFAPKDRKYPNGSRSNRATEKGYWKATGKDRVIRSKGPTRSATVVGMKKTLVFHKGRAPRGERTHWIMHEYRTTELEYESGEQGGYVLYKLFRKPDDRAPGQADEAGPTNIDEVDRSGFSPAPSRSSPLNETQQDGDSLDEITAPPAERKPVLQNDPLNLANSVLGTRVGIQEWLDEGTTDCKPAKQHENTNSNFALGPSQNMHVGPAPVSLLDQISDPCNKKNDYQFGAPKQENHHSLGYPVGDINQPDAVDDIIDSFFADVDVYSPGESIRQDNSADVAVSDYLDNAIQGDGNQDEALWPDGMINIDDLLMDVPDDCINGSLYENASFPPYNTTDQDVYSFDSGAESLQDMFNTFEESSAHKNNNLIPSNNDASGPRQLEHLFTQNFAPTRTRELQANFNSSYNNQINYISSTNEDTIGGGGTGIIVRSRGGDCYQQSVHSGGISSVHGTAPKRVILQTTLKFGTISCPKPDGTELGEQVDEENSGEEVSAESSNNTSSGLSGVENLEEEPSINDNGDAPKPKDTAKLRKKNITQGAKNNESAKMKSFVSPKRSPRKVSFAYLFWIVISALLILFCIGIYRSLTYNINV